jgi:hypothetical protein
MKVRCKNNDDLSVNHDPISSEIFQFWTFQIAKGEVYGWHTMSSSKFKSLREANETKEVSNYTKALFPNTAIITLSIVCSNSATTSSKAIAQYALNPVVEPMLI